MRRPWDGLLASDLERVVRNAIDRAGGIVVDLTIEGFTTKDRPGQSTLESGKVRVEDAGSWGGGAEGGLVGTGKMDSELTDIAMETDRKGGGFIEMETTDGLENSVVFHVVKEIIGFICIIRFLPMALHLGSVGFQTMQEESKENVTRVKKFS
ncbi:hypothetical protein QJS10_CPB22g00155 [Acorus calamus]|uniref:Uncharacterized protein n=1 Tax=Acorus calamus TaxID=4465 RepID=A0AAV9BZZ7_ACOCL|nr:hypothetical protein QJS10_CPB22g00155 [Acorus calamus]